jgi:hypothetical protein
VADINKYQALKQAGLSPTLIYQTLKADGLERIACIKMLRQLLDISVVEAKELMTEVDAGRMHDSVQAALTPDLDQAFVESQREAVLRMLQQLERVHARPEMYIGTEIRALRDYLNGLYTGFILCWDMPENVEHLFNSVRQSVLVRRGWQETNWHIVSVMSSFGYPYKAIVNETIGIEIEAWKLTYNIPVDL